MLEGSPKLPSPEPAPAPKDKPGIIRGWFGQVKRFASKAGARLVAAGEGFTNIVVLDSERDALRREREQNRGERVLNESNPAPGGTVNTTNDSSFSGNERPHYEVAEPLSLSAQAGVDRRRLHIAKGVIGKKDEQIETLNNEAETLGNQLDKALSKIEKLNNEVDEKNQLIGEKDQQIKSLNNEAEILGNQLDQALNINNALINKNGILEKEVQALRDQLEDMHRAFPAHRNEPQPTAAPSGSENGRDPNIPNNLGGTTQLTTQEIPEKNNQEFSRNSTEKIMELAKQAREQLNERAQRAVEWYNQQPTTVRVGIGVALTGFAFSTGSFLAIPVVAKAVLRAAGAYGAAKTVGTLYEQRLKSKTIDGVLSDKEKKKIKASQAATLIGSFLLGSASDYILDKEKYDAGMKLVKEKVSLLSDYLTQENVAQMNTPTVISGDVPHGIPFDPGPTSMNIDLENIPQVPTLDEQNVVPAPKAEHPIGLTLIQKDDSLLGILRNNDFATILSESLPRDKFLTLSKKGVETMYINLLQSLTPDQLQEAGISSGNIHKLLPGEKIDLNKLAQFATTTRPKLVGMFDRFFG